MDIFKILGFKSSALQEIPHPEPPLLPPPTASYSNGNILFSVSYDGEKNIGEIGPIKDYKLDYDLLRMRSWQSYLESEISQTVLNKFSKWVIGAGLKLQAEPVKSVLEMEKIKFDSESFNSSVEGRFSVYAKSKMSDYAGMSNLHRMAREAFVNAIIGGDVLVVLRFISNQVKVQLIDGAHIQSPKYSSAEFAQAKSAGNRIKNGIELSPSGEHIAFYVQKSFLEVEKIPAKTDGVVTAFMVYGMKYRLDNVRGMPLIAAVLETLKKLERYKEATVGSAEERQKIVYYAKHDMGSTGENPLSRQIVKAMNVDAVTDDLPNDVNGKQLANTFAATTNKQMINMPVNSDLKSLESKNELYFKDFYSVNIDLVCACLGIPPEVAMSKYDSNFSASRAALKDWEHTINVNRADFSFQFYQNIYNVWIHAEILKNKISAPGYLKAWSDKDEVVLESYRNARFAGATVPHIDPLKEVKAEREKLGPLGENIPLTTVEAATEVLNGGDSKSNMEQYSKEIKEADRLGIKPKEQPVPVSP